MTADFEVGDGAIADAGLLWCGCQGVHVVLAIDDEHRTTVGGVDLVVAMQGGIEECLCYGLLIGLACASGVAQVRVLHIYLGRLERELLALWIEHVQQARILEVFNIVHCGRTRAIDGVCQTADVETARRLLEHEVEQFAQLRQGTDLNLLDEQHVHLKDHIHHLQQRLGEVVRLEEERIVAMVKVVIKILQWLDILADLLRNLHMVLEDILERIDWQLETECDIEVLAEAEATQVVGMYNIADVMVILDESHDG